MPQAAVGMGLTFNRRAKSWHIHWHVLADVEWADQVALRRVWSAALGSSAFVKVGRARSVSGLFREILRGSRDDADRLLKIPHCALGEAALALKGRRRFRLVGSPPVELSDVPPREIFTRSAAQCPKCGVTFRWADWEVSAQVAGGHFNEETVHWEKARSSGEAVTTDLYRGFAYQEIAPSWALPRRRSVGENAPSEVQPGLELG
ncbi:unnamed protein product [marine sediment metagenome]|uniref:Uncharacterized protein n=1 Tax=marine sediment metagenome TaxID=412755 RepID=X1RMI0_9ZZZZ